LYKRERKQEKEGKEKTYHRVERTYGKYYRSFTLPKEIKVDEIGAEFKDGQLSITIPKAEEIKPKELEIKVK
jgi:HSP20 family protein